MGFFVYLGAVALFNVGGAFAMAGEMWGWGAVAGAVWMAVAYSNRHPA